MAATNAGTVTAISDRSYQASRSLAKIILNPSSVGGSFRIWDADPATVCKELNLTKFPHLTLMDIVSRVPIKLGRAPKGEVFFISWMAACVLGANIRWEDVVLRAAGDGTAEYQILRLEHFNKINVDLAVSIRDEIEAETIAFLDSLLEEDDPSPASQPVVSPAPAEEPSTAEGTKTTAIAVKDPAAIALRDTTAIALRDTTDYVGIFVFQTFVFVLSLVISFASSNYIFAGLSLLTLFNIGMTAYAAYPPFILQENVRDKAMEFFRERPRTFSEFVAWGSFTEELAAKILRALVQERKIVEDFDEERDVWVYFPPPLCDMEDLSRRCKRLRI